MRRCVLERLEDEQADEPDLVDVGHTVADALHTLNQIRGKRPA